MNISDIFESRRRQQHHTGQNSTSVGSFFENRRRDPNAYNREEPPKKTFMDHAFDVLSGPSRASAGFTEEFFTRETPHHNPSLNILEKTKHGLKRAGTELLDAIPGVEMEGAQRQGYGDIIREHAKPTSTAGKAAASVAGFAGDIALDPLTYIPGLNLAKVKGLPALLKTRKVRQVEDVEDVIDPALKRAREETASAEQAWETSQEAVKNAPDAVSRMQADQTQRQAKESLQRAREAEKGILERTGEPTQRTVTREEQYTPAAAKVVDRLRDNRLVKEIGKTFDRDFELNRLGIDEGGLDAYKTARSRAELDLQNVSRGDDVLRQREEIAQAFKTEILDNPDIARRLPDTPGGASRYGRPKKAKNLTGLRQILKYGTKPKEGEVVMQFGIENYAVPKQVAEDFKKVEKMFTDKNAVLKKYDNLLGTWKGMALLSGGWHVRNILGNAFNNFLAGVDNPKFYKQAFDAQAGKMGIEGSKMLDEAERLGVIDRGLFKRDIEADLLRNPDDMSKVRRFFSGDNPILEKNAWIGTQLENNARLAHYLQKVSTGKTPKEAAESVQKYLFDYSDITPREEHLKRLIPFYSWIKKNGALQLSQLVENPGRYSVAPKGIEAVEGLSREPHEDPIEFLETQTVRTPLKHQGRDLYYRHAMPFSDLDRDSIKGEMSSLTPALSALSAAIPEKGYSLFKGDAIERYPGQETNFLGIPMRKKYAEAISSINPLIGKAHRSQKAIDRGEGLLRLLSEIGFTLTPDYNQRKRY